MGWRRSGEPDCFRVPRWRLVPNCSRGSRVERAVGDRIDGRFMAIDIATRTRYPTRVKSRELIEFLLNFGWQRRFSEVFSRSVEYPAERDYH